MKEKIIEIMKSHATIYREVVLVNKCEWKDVAEEILELFKNKQANAQELNMKAVRCDCRHCQPELWEKDDRDIWINISP